jgi:hypothetical protein
VGLTLESDCLVVIVSEETGGISIAERGQVELDIPRERFRAVLAQRLEAPAPEPGPAPAQAYEAGEPAGATAPAAAARAEVAEVSARE